MIILPANYGLDATNPEAYVAIAVSSFIREVGKEKSMLKELLHASIWECLLYMPFAGQI